MKCLQEEGFHVTGFEQRPDAGGLWTFSENPKYTSATNGTRYQLSKFLVRIYRIFLTGYDIIFTSDRLTVRNQTRVHSPISLFQKVSH